MDVVLVPLRLQLLVRLLVKILGFEKIIISRVLWEYTTPAIRGEIFNFNDAEPDETPPAFSVYEGSVSGQRFKFQIAIFLLSKHVIRFTNSRDIASLLTIVFSYTHFVTNKPNTYIIHT